MIEVAREITGSQRYDANSGVSQRVFTQYFQNAQTSLINVINNAKSKYFLKQGESFPVVANQEFYAYPDDLYLKNIDTIEWNDNGVQDSWIPLEKCITKDRLSTMSGWPFGYFPQEDGVRMTPPMTSGRLRFNYIRRANRVEKRSGQITAVTGSPVTSITLDAAEASYDPSYLAKFDYVCVVGSSGVQKSARIPLTSVASNVLNIGSFTIPSGEAIAIGDYVVAGYLSTNKPEMDEVCETYLLLYAQYQAKYGDASAWSAEMKTNLIEQATEVVKAIGLLSDDVSQIPITNCNYLALW